MFALQIKDDTLNSIIECKSSTKRKALEFTRGDTTRIRTWTFNMPSFGVVVWKSEVNHLLDRIDGRTNARIKVHPSEFSLIHLPFTWKRGPVEYSTLTHSYIRFCSSIAAKHSRYNIQHVCVCLRYVYILALVDLNSGKKGRTSSHRKSRHIWMEAQAIDLLYSIENICANGMHGTAQYSLVECAHKRKEIFGKNTAMHKQETFANWIIAIECKWGIKKMKIMG